MNRSLQFASGIVVLLISVSQSMGQVILAENFSGFSTGSHSTPSTTDASSSLDSKTSVPGWTGSLVYPAGGEIKIGTSSLTGWIETPALDLSPNGGYFIFRFEIARWPGDAATVQVSLNGSAIGSVITPGDDFQQVQITGNSGTSSSRFRIQALTKRFYLDNLSVTSESTPTLVAGIECGNKKVKVYPVPARNILSIENAGGYQTIEIHDLSGRIIERVINEGNSIIRLDISGYHSGIYLLTLRGNEESEYIRFLKI